MRTRRSSARTVARTSRSALPSRSSSPAKASPTSRGAVLTAEHPGGSSVAVVGMVAEPLGLAGRCILLSVPLVARIARCHSNPEPGGRCTARTATPAQGGRGEGSAASVRGSQTAVGSQVAEDGQVGMVPRPSVVYQRSSGLSCFAMILCLAVAWKERCGEYLRR